MVHSHCVTLERRVVIPHVSRHTLLPAHLQLVVLLQDLEGHGAQQAVGDDQGDERDVRAEAGAQLPHVAPEHAALGGRTLAGVRRVGVHVGPVHELLMVLVAFQTNDWAPPDRMTGQWEVEARKDDRGGEKQKEKFLRKSKRTQDLNPGSAAPRTSLCRHGYDAMVQDGFPPGVTLRRAVVADEPVPVASSVRLLTLMEQLSRVATLSCVQIRIYSAVTIKVRLTPKGVWRQS
ncbi:Folliculin-interacting protein 2 [Frankliniella fusca]|uniref:Folliculin-interacting protein 2 n=1 Tax=Frankliniella fusca TaxID=407009 RepID=A0AAE1LC36_9NEOP|nr:Folliculin-interacting protein 2 [Frankliniella fusca]